MRINCPLCGERDIREFSYRGAATDMDRPDPGAGDVAWDDFVHNRENPAGMTRDLWYHEAGCAAWLVVSRSTTTHQVAAAQLAAKVKSSPAGDQK